MNNDIAYLICEQTYSERPTILSSSNEIKERRSVKVQQTLQDADVWNRNKRNYQKNAIVEGLARENIVEMVTRKQWYGEAGHPVDPSLTRQLTIDPKLRSHRILKHWWSGNFLKGELETALTQYGYELKDAILYQELEMAVSLRAVGSIKETPNGKIVGSPLQMVTYDWVFYPSHKVAYADNVIKAVNESGNRMIMNESVLLPITSQQQSAVDYVKDKSINFRIVSEVFGFESGNVTITPDNKKVILSESGSGDKIVVNMETYISTEFDNYMSKIK